MRLKVNDVEDFQVALDLNINYELGYIEVTVTTWNKKKHTVQTKQFPASDFDKALAYYHQQEKMFA